MIKYSDLQFMWSKNENPDAVDNLDQFIAVAIGIDGTVQQVFGTYISFFDLLKSNYSLIDSSSSYNDGKFYVDFVNNGEIVETLQAPEKIWALLLSDADVFEILRDATITPSYTRDGLKYYTSEGWTYSNISGEYQVTPPANWSLPADFNLSHEDKREAHLLRLNQMRERYLQSPQIDPEILAKIDREIAKIG